MLRECAESRAARRTPAPRPCGRCARRCATAAPTTRASTPIRRPASAIGARRLAIIDVDGGHQPLCQRGRHRLGRPSTARSTTTRSCASELRAPRPRRFATQLRHRGAGPPLRGVRRRRCVHALEGMFAFAIWDARARRLLLGARPLRREAALLHEQRRRAALRLRADRAARRPTPTLRELDPAAVDAFFVFGYVARRRGTIVAGVRQLPPGHLLTWERATAAASERRWWTPAGSRPCSAREPPPTLVGRGRAAARRVGAQRGWSPTCRSASSSAAASTRRSSRRSPPGVLARG